MSFNQRSIFVRTGLSVAVAMSVMSSAAVAEEVYKLGEVVVTAARTAQTVDETLAPVTVIDREQIENSQATSVTELLSQAPGVQIANNGGPGSKSGVFIRGTSTEQTLVLMDGQKLNTAQAGSAPLEYLDPEQIERIEIVRGPRSTIYGADAVGGVINIITRKGIGAPALTLKAGVGSRGTGEYGINFGGESEGTRFNLGARLFETEGYDRTATTVGFDGDDDAFRNKSASGSLSHDFGRFSAGVNFSHSEGKAEYDVNYAHGTQGTPISYFELSNVNTYAEMEVSDTWGSRMELGFQRDHRNDIGPSPSNASNKRYSINWINDIAWAENQYLIAGVDYANDFTETSYNYTEDERYNTGAFAQNTTSFESSELQVGARYDRNEAYGDKTTGSLSWGFELPHQMKLIASYGTAFRAPTFMNLYSGSSGNPDLKPETAQNAELELRGQLNSASNWSVNLYQNNMQDMIIYSDGKMQNVEQARIQGMELSVSTVLMDWNLNANISVLDPENRTLDKQLVRRANQLFSVNADKGFGRWTLGATFRGQGAAWDSTDNKTNRLPGFGTIDLRASVNLTTELKTQFKIVNLMDKEYATASGYIDEPRGVFATIVWSPEL
ncbi:TonB-dependent receptor domain-containing protein [Endozoicomonas sp. SESOKO1]|uniref:TonB-dependent receptor domain-containing protein n=1 Tax=Endozoicomonas sp. SESOKO1 TaxID=2828742 RepID=UPI0021481055|nr:TonB-dependent receptor [Endozoicomonas sp. SESOKO1]